MPTPSLYQWGPVQFQVFPLNIGEVDHVTGTAWARKEVAGAAIYREWVGEEDEEIHLRGKLFPHFYRRHWLAARQDLQHNLLTAGNPKPGQWGNEADSNGGLAHLELLDNMRRLGQAHTLVRGDGWHLGWFVIERLTRGHSYLGREGIGQQIQFDATFQRVPVPLDPASYYPSIWSATQGMQ